MLTTNYRAWLAEFLGTFMLVFAGTGAIVIDQSTSGSITHVGVALTFGLVVMALIYALGDVSGCHLNPAVSIGFWLAKSHNASRCAAYIVAQCAGAIAASALLRVLFPDHVHLGATLPRGSAAQSFVLETILTTFLMYVILAMVYGDRANRPWIGVVVGGVVGLEAMFAGPICGASMNPARSIGPALVSGHVSSLWIYIIAPVLGSCIAYILFRCLESPKSP